MTVPAAVAKAPGRSTGAPPANEVTWDRINWDQVAQEVARLQVRIAKASKVGRWNKVKALQRLLTSSRSGKLLAVKRVTENKGKRTAGVDGKIWSTPASKLKAVQSLEFRGYRPLPLRRVYIPKSNGKERPLGIPCMRDRAMQALWLLALSPVAETTADPNSYGFRPRRSTADAIEQCFCTLAKRASAQWILEGDIRGCFDNISHSWLEENIPMDRAILSRWLKAGYMERGKLFPTEAGTPQGGIASPVLANMALDGLEEAVWSAARRITTARQKSKVNVIRYADDFIVTAASRELLEQCVKPTVEKFLAARGLHLAPEKTFITHISEGFDFLGQNVRKYGDKLLIKPARKSVKALLDKVREVLKKNMAATQAQVIMLLNPILRGWAMYHRHVVAAATFTKVDHLVCRMLWNWAKRRHPRKNTGWVKARYFRRFGPRDWIFACPACGYKQMQWFVLFRAETLPILRHTKIRSDANLFDPAWTAYFQRRSRA
ncbi:group II intron reverse transcriptase/maturase [Paraburkholderia silvatlantica]|uniref:RNA-directed DNA polymerase n=1 Tax=Paraburkholderia silvatlantica TaxID=321895 RepID=A0ABR6FZU6_9BURK|nr:group II intron reverse transcriptase/maturase [Paraburkholderia silvatlantica]MBB2932973.1 RNA-directed DNA polymerase [Paraburkholderia silvatlantica]PVY14319.1 RNA-directed DNA polymerase [Paraburkholderia silvatlantica]PXW22799.1 RNA-directed DNA polymerase [Paraburkholderia silvatlantica]